VFRSAMTALTAVSVLWHAVAGCCAHHDHSHEVASSPKQTAERSDTHALRVTADNCAKSCRCKCKAKGGSTELAKSDAETTSNAQRAKRGDAPRPEPCDEEQCSFLATKISTAAEVVCGQSSTVWSSVVVLDLQEGPSTSRGIPVPIDDRPPPLRSHLALHVLLI